MSGGLGAGNREIRVRAGEAIKLNIPILGSPAPTVKWKKNGKEVTKDQVRSKSKEKREECNGFHYICIYNQ